MHQAVKPFKNNWGSFPAFGMSTATDAGEKHLAEMAKAFGEARMTDNGLTTGEQARQFAFGRVRDAVSGEGNQQSESWRSPWGNASVNLMVDDEGNF
ncbi:invasin, partial [Enterobacter cloacae]